MVETSQHAMGTKRCTLDGLQQEATDAVMVWIERLEAVTFSACSQMCAHFQFMIL